MAGLALTGALTRSCQFRDEDADWLDLDR